MTVESWDQDTLILLMYRMRGEDAAQIEISPQVKVQTLLIEIYILIIHMENSLTIPVSAIPL